MENQTRSRFRGPEPENRGRKTTTKPKTAGSKTRGYPNQNRPAVILTHQRQHVMWPCHVGSWTWSVHGTVWPDELLRWTLSMFLDFRGTNYGGYCFAASCLAACATVMVASSSSPQGNVSMSADEWHGSKFNRLFAQWIRCLVGLVGLLDLATRHHI